MKRISWFWWQIFYDVLRRRHYTRYIDPFQVFYDQRKIRENNKIHLLEKLAAVPRSVVLLAVLADFRKRSLLADDIRHG